MNAALSSAIHHLSLAMGWTLVLATCQTALIALAAWGWTRTGLPPSSASRHRLAMGGLALGVLCAAATFAWVWSAPSGSAGLRPPQLSRTASRPASVPSIAATRPIPAATTDGFPPSRLIAWTGLAWLGVALAFGGRSVGGLLVVRLIRRRADPLRSVTLRKTVEGLEQRMGLRRRIALLESSEVDAPAAVGWWRAALVFPPDFDTALAGEQLAPVVAHEIEHVRRHDPLVAMVQAALDAVLWPCPGARWLSSLAQKTRELSCDDAAVRLCGDRAAYAAALGALASLGCGGGPSPVLGVAGVSLVERIRRILKGETMTRLSSLQVTCLAAACLVLGWGTARLTAAALDQTGAERPTIGAASSPSAVPGVELIPYWYGALGEASPATITGVDSTAEYVFDRVRVRNVSESRLVSLTFVAIVEGRGSERPVVLARSQPVSAALAPGEAALLTVQLLPATQVASLKRELGDKVQSRLAVLSARHADGTEWSLTPRSGARTAAAALYADAPFVTRGLIKPPPALPTNNRQCLDDRGRAYSEGALVRILDEPGRSAVCRSGVWLEAAASAVAAKRE